MAVTEKPNNRIIPVCPAAATCGVLMFLWHLFIALIHWLGLGQSDDPKNLSVRRPNRMVLGQSCRGLFCCIWERYVAKDAKVLVSPCHHHSFIRMMHRSGRKIDVAQSEGDVLLEPRGKTGRDYDVIVLTQMLGRDFQCEWLLKWRKQNPNLLVLNDRVQGGALTQEDTRLSDVSFYSLGQDKIPNTMGGGYAIVHHNDELYEWLVANIEALPFESAWDRLKFLLLKIPTVGVYNIRIFCIVFDFVASILGFKRNSMIDGYRKKNPGFMHDGYMIRPSPALLESMKALDNPGDYFQKWEQYQKQCTEQMRKFHSFIPEEIADRVKVCGAESACSYFFIQLAEMEQSRELLAERGVLTISNQTYLPFEPSTGDHYVKNMITLPVLTFLTDAEIKRVADAVAETYAKFG